jgi:hypothetical protein
MPLPAPGLTIVLPLANVMTPGSVLALYRVDPATGNLVPALDTGGLPVTGIVDAPHGLSATFSGVASLSTVVGLIPGLTTVIVDIRPGGFPNSVNPAAHGVIPVAILSSASFDATAVDPLSIRFGPDGAFEAHGRGHIDDADGDGDADLILHFAVAETGIKCGDVFASLVGTTLGGQLIQGSDSITTASCR